MLDPLDQVYLYLTGVISTGAAVVINNCHLIVWNFDCQFSSNAWKPAAKFQSN